MKKKPSVPIGSLITSVNPTLWILLYMVFALTAVFTHLGLYPIPHLIENILYIGFFSIFILSMVIVGNTVLSKLSLFSTQRTDPDPWEFFLSLGLGLGILSTLLLLIGWAIPGSFALKLNLLVVFLGLFTVLRIPFTPLKRSLAFLKTDSSFSPMDMGYLMLGCLGLLFPLVASFSPITYYDSLVYHLALPKLYLAQGSISSIPYNLYSHFPACVETIFLFFMYVCSNPEIPINLFSWFLSLGIGFLLYDWTKRETNKSGGLLAWGLWGCIPAVMFLSVGGYVEVPLAFFTVVALYSFSMARKERWDWRWMLVSGLFCGFAASTKYTGVVTLLILSSFLFVTVLRQKNPKWRSFLFFLGAPFLSFGFWLLKNFLEVGNPVFPFFYNTMGGDIGWTTETASSYFRMLTEYGSKSDVLTQFFKAPFTIFTDAKKFGGGFDVLGDFGWNLFLILAPFSIFFIKKHKRIRWIFFYMLLHFVVWYFTKPVLRFLIPVLPLMVLFGVLFLFHISKINKFVKPLTHLFIIVPLVLSNFILYFFLNKANEPFSVALGIESRKEYLSRKFKFFPILDTLNQKKDSGLKVLFLGDQRVYHADFDVLVSNIFAPSLLSQWCNKAKSNGALLAHFKQEKITHLLIDEGEIQRLGGYGRYGFTTEGENRLNKFRTEKSYRILKSHNLALYSIQ